MLSSKRINGVEICYDESGYDDGPAIVLLTGWAHDVSLYNELLPYLAKKHWVIRVGWRGHGPSRDKIEDFGILEQVNDTLALLEQLGVDQFYVVSHSHGGWAALELVDSIGKPRVRGVVMIDQIMTAQPPEFEAALHNMQCAAVWRSARKSLFTDWIAHSDNQPVLDHIIFSLSSFGYDMWSLSCRVISNAYATWGSPLGRMATFSNPSPIHHIFSHPLNKPEYRQLQQDFAKKHSWFTYKDLEGETHFPSLEIPDRVAEEIEDLIRKTS
ncbi:hypothetical protein ACHAPJ_013554 [Fusarium lateritium]